jgi:hypothetical protein
MTEILLPPRRQRQNVEDGENLGMGLRLKGRQVAHSRFLKIQNWFVYRLHIDRQR